MNTTRLPAALLACTIVAAALPAQAQVTGTYTLSKVTFSGNAQVPTSELEAALPIQVGQKIDQAGLQQEMSAIQQVYEKHNVGANMSQRITVTHGTRALIAYSFVEQAPVAPTVTHVGITADHVGVTGNAKVKTADILAAAGLKPGDTLTNEKIAAAQASVLALYKKANVGCTINTDWTNTATPQHVDLTFKVVEKTDS